MIKSALYCQLGEGWRKVVYGLVKTSFYGKKLKRGREVVYKIKLNQKLENGKEVESEGE